MGSAIHKSNGALGLIRRAKKCIRKEIAKIAYCAPVILKCAPDSGDAPDVLRT